MAGAAGFGDLLVQDRAIETREAVAIERALPLASCFGGWCVLEQNIRCTRVISVELMRVSEEHQTLRPLPVAELELLDRRWVVSSDQMKEPEEYTAGTQFWVQSYRLLQVRFGSLDTARGHQQQAVVRVKRPRC